jgi:hypothetical protein
MFTLLPVDVHDMKWSSTEIKFHLLKLPPPQKGAAKYTAQGHHFVRLCCRAAQSPGIFTRVAWSGVIKDRCFLFLPIETCTILRVI